MTIQGPRRGEEASMLFSSKPLTPPFTLSNILRGPFAPMSFPIDKYTRLALDKVK